MSNNSTQKKLFYPAEWQEQVAVWFAFPHNEDEWDAFEYESGSRLDAIREFYYRLITLVLDFQNVNLIFPDQELFTKVQSKINKLTINKPFKLQIYIIPNNDIWIRDYGPFFMQGSHGKKLALDFGFNAWGGKFSPWYLDDAVPKFIAEQCGYTYKEHSMILEGGSLEFNGEDLILTTEQCLLNDNRNPDLSHERIEQILKEEFSIEEIIWLKRGLEGDHTDGHIDDFARFIAANKIVICQTENIQDPNYQHLKESFDYLSKWRHPKTNAGLELITIPLPEPMKLEDHEEPLPCSYANFIFVNGGLVVPIFNSKHDQEALEILQKALPDRKVIGIDARVLIQEGGGIHCMSKQEPI